MSSSSQRLIMLAPPASSVARDPSGGCSPGLYLPVSAPCAIGDQTTCDRPSSSQVGPPRARGHHPPGNSPPPGGAAPPGLGTPPHSALYGGCSDTSGTCSSPASVSAARISSARHSETPM